MIAIRGAHSKIAIALVAAISGKDKFSVVGRSQSVPLDADRYFFCQGVLYGKPMMESVEFRIAETFLQNCARVIADCDRIFAINDRARICVVGSESGFSWSHDGAYAASKAALHRYVETKRLRTPDQQLVCVSPGIIEDSGMTERRTDLENLERRREAHPKKRFLTAAEVAGLVHHVLYVDRGYLSGVVLRMNGGEHACR